MPGSRHKWQATTPRSDRRRAAPAAESSGATRERRPGAPPGSATRERHPGAPHPSAARSRKTPPAAGLLVPTLDQDISVIEFQAQADPLIYHRLLLEMALVGERYPQRVVRGFVLFAEAALDPCTEPWHGLMNLEEILRMLGELTPLEETRAYKDLVAKGMAIGRQEGRQEGRRREARRLVLMLQRRVGTVPDAQQRRIAALSVEQLESLGAALLDFRDPAELNAWLADH